MLSTITSVGRGGIANVLQAPKEHFLKNQLKKEESK